MEAVHDCPGGEAPGEECILKLEGRSVVSCLKVPVFVPVFVSVFVLMFVKEESPERAVDVEAVGSDWWSQFVKKEVVEKGVSDL